jgi:hypothetical protein
MKILYNFFKIINMIINQALMSIILIKLLVYNLKQLIKVKII